MTAGAWKKWRYADIHQIDIAKAFGFDGFKLEAALKLPAPPPKPVPGMPIPKPRAA